MTFFKFKKINNKVHEKLIWLSLKLQSVIEDGNKIACT